VNVAIPDLPRTLLQLLRQIPCGRVTTYGDLAEALGDIAAARWVGEFLLDHPHDEDCPCHRVVRRTGNVGLFIGKDVAEKIRRLAADGIDIAQQTVDLARLRFADFHSNEPLRTLADQQRDITERVSFERFPSLPERVGGFDVSYHDSWATAALVVVELHSGELLESFTLRKPAAFPYIPGYLSYRELPPLLGLLESLPEGFRIPDVTLVDGNGVLHHRAAGIASHFGVLARLRTIGVGKKLLCGLVDLDGLSPGTSRPVVLAGRQVGAAIKASPRSRPVFVSTGHRIALRDAVRITMRLFHGHRLPEPLYFADRLSREAAKSSA